MKDDFYCVTRRITWGSNGKARLTETRTTGRIDAGKERLTACCGKSVPWNTVSSKSSSSKVA